MRIRVLFCSVLLLGCSYSDPLDLPGLDSDAFKGDRGGCNGGRKKQIELVETYQDRFVGISENEIIKALGRYDYQVLSRRNEKVFVYFLESGPQCQAIQAPTEALSLVLYLNAVKLVREVAVQRGGYSD